VNSDLAKFTVNNSHKLPQWMSEHGVHWQQPLAGTMHLGRTNRWFLGGGKALVNTYFQTVARMGITVRYEAMVEDILIENDRFEAVVVRDGDSQQLLRAKAVVVASGGYEANIEWLKRHWGPAAENFIVRGTPYNDGVVLAALLKRGAKPIGDPKGFHAIAVDARSPKFDGGIVTRLDAVPFGIVLNKFAKRFSDEGENVWPKRYASWGGLIAGQPDQIAFCIVDSKTIGRFLPPVFKPHQAETVRGLAPATGLDPEALAQTVEEYNRSVAGNTNLRMDKLDDNCTRGLTPPKSHWALPIDTPPFYACPLRPGITFTYMGVTVDECARVLNQSGQPFKGLYAAGEIMSGNVLVEGYLAGFGLTIGSVFGELAGREAANGRA
jgi:tricarballylate dehydrogenase